MREGASEGDHPDIRRQFDEFALEYDGFYSGDLVMLEDRILAGLLQPYTVGRRVLDLGCGTARFAELVKYRKYVGVDISPKMLELAPKGDDRDYIPSDWNEPEYRDEFDVVMNTFSGGAYRPLEDLWEVTERALGWRGRFWHMVPTPQVGERQTYGMFDNPDDLYRYTPEEVLRSLPSESTKAVWSVDAFLYFQPTAGEPPYLKGVNDSYSEDYCYTIIMGEYDAKS